MKAKTDYTHGRFVLATTDYDAEDYRDVYEQFCEDGYLERDEGVFYDWCAEQARICWETDLDNIRRHDSYQTPVVVTGTLGLWWGHPEVKPVRCESVYEALIKCFGECDHITTTYDDGVIRVEAARHDGTNCFTIRALSKKGERRVSGEYDKKDFKRFKYLYA